MRTDKKDIIISYYGHACFKIGYDHHSIVIDPYVDKSVPNLRLPLDMSANEVFCSHEHHDHNARELINIINDNIKVDVEEILVPHDKNNGRDRGMNYIRIFNINGYRICHLGDIGVLPNPRQLEKLNGIDILFAPINGFYTISSEEVFDLVNLIKPRVVIPMHYFNEEYRSGYKDGNQIEKFKSLFPNYYEVSYQFNISDVLDKQVVIFNKYIN